MPDTYDYITLMCRLKAAQARNKELESGERYVKLKELHQKDCRDYEHKILELQTEIAEAHGKQFHCFFNKNKTAPQPWQAIAQRFCSIRSLRIICLVRGEK
nr:hypothetical protein [uncultured Blautia sp.]